MCGIVGYVGEQNAVPVLISGLQSLEYRGYDSAGVAVLNEDKIGISIACSDFVSFGVLSFCCLDLLVLDVVFAFVVFAFEFLFDEVDFFLPAVAIYNTLPNFKHTINKASIISCFVKYIITY